MDKKNINVNCYNNYCVFNNENKCIRTEISFNRVGVCENMFLINARHIENLQGIKFNYLKNIFGTTDEIIQQDIEWFHKQLNSKEVNPLEEIFEEAKKLIDNKNRTRK